MTLLLLAWSWAATVSIADYGAVPAPADSTVAIKAAWAALKPGDTLDVPPGRWLVAPHGPGYPVLRADQDDLSVRLAPGAVLALLPGAAEGPIIGSNGASGPRKNLTIYGGGTLESYSVAYSTVVWSSQQSRALEGLTLDGITIEGGRDSVYVGAYAVGTTLVRGVACRHPYRYAIVAGDKAGGLLRVERSHLGRPSIASSVPHALHIETGALGGLRVEVVDHTTSDATLSFNSAVGWLAEDVVLRDGVVMASRAGTLRRGYIQWRRPPNASPRCVLLQGDCSGSVIEDVTVDALPALVESDDRSAVAASLSSDVVLRRVRILTPPSTYLVGVTPSMVVGPGAAYITGQSPVLEDVAVVLVPR